MYDYMNAEFEETQSLLRELLLETVNMELLTACLDANEQQEAWPF